jgi:hypothetical protein
VASITLVPAMLGFFGTKARRWRIDAAPIPGHNQESVRTVLVASAMQVFGRVNWWVPRRLRRSLPTWHGEPVRPAPVLAELASKG